MSRTSPWQPKKGRAGHRGSTSFGARGKGEKMPCLERKKKNLPVREREDWSIGGKEGKGANVLGLEARLPKEG